MATTLTPGGIGRLVHAGDDDWNAARATFNTLIDQRPEAVVLPADDREVAAAVRWARGRGLRVAPQSTGHNAGALGDLGGTVLLNVSRLREIRIDAAARRVRVGAGTRWRDVAPQLSPLGLAALHGSSPDVGIAGYSLGGGMGWLARRHGLQCNAVTAIELVTADGTFVRADHDHEPDLFWALRGGGGSFGVVTAIEFAVHEVPAFYAGAMFLPVERAGELMHTWGGMLPGLPRELMSWVSLIRFPDMPAVPPPLRGGAFAIFIAAYTGDEASGRDLVAPVRALGPAIDTFAIVPPAGLAELAMDPPEPLPIETAHHLLGAPGPAMWDALAATVRSGPASTLDLVNLRHLGGALAEASPGAGARATLPGDLSLLSVGVIPTPDRAPVVSQGLGEIQEAMLPWRVGDYPNFVERPADARSFFDAASWERLQRVKAAWDAGDLMRGNHHVPLR
ncbi:MAG: FAD-binding oxidoreductase [Thermoleophilia bacterium]